MTLFDRVTARLVAELEAGAAPWLKPWKVSVRNGTSIMPHNAATGRPYSGINIPILWAAAADKEYPNHQWLTYKQAMEKGAHVLKGEKATEVVFTKKIKITEDEEEKEISMLRSYFVFNIDQVDDLDLPTENALSPETRIATVDTFVKLTGANIQHGGNQALYSPTLDIITMPPYGAFKSTEGYYATLLHECGHWTGPRLERDLKNRFGTQAYAAEELIAELTSAFLCAQMGIEGDLRHAGYLATWATLLKSDNRAIFTAAAKAQQAANFLNTFSTTSKHAVTSAAA